MSDLKSHRTIAAFLCQMLFVASLAGLCALTSCGGGTSGTGLEDAQVVSLSGRLTSSDGVGLQHTQVILLETGEIAFTDEQGNFSFASGIGLTSYTFEVMGIVSHNSLGDAALNPSESAPINYIHLELTLEGKLEVVGFDRLPENEPSK